MQITLERTDLSNDEYTKLTIDLGSSLDLTITPGIGQIASACDTAKPTTRFVGLDHSYEPTPDTGKAPYVHDTHTGLIWSRTCAINGEAKRMDHAAAVKQAAELGEGWRLPTRTELLTLVDDTTHEPAIDKAAFPDTESSYYWTSTPAAWSPSSVAWVVFFDFGLAGTLRHGDGAFVRAVRVASFSSQ